MSSYHVLLKQIECATEYQYLKKCVNYANCFWIIIQRLQCFVDDLYFMSGYPVLAMT